MWIRTLAIAIGLFFATIGVQGPEFAQQYRQRLAGAIDELTRVVAEFDAEAAGHSLTPDVAIQRLEANADPLARERGAAAEFDRTRLARLQLAFAAMKDAPTVTRLWVVAQHFDAGVGARTFADYEPAAPTTGEAFVVGAIFGLWGWGATHLCAWPIRRRMARRREAAGSVAPRQI